MREVFEGELTIFRQKKSWSWKRPTNPYYAPMYWVACTDRPSIRDRHYLVKFHSMPRGLSRFCHGHPVRVTCTLKPWSNGLGGWGLRPVGECLTPEEDVLHALTTGFEDAERPGPRR